MENHRKLVLLLGSNSGDRKAILKQSLSEINQKLGVVVKKSAIYESKAWGFDGYDFLNQVVIVECEKDAKECLSITQKIEQQLGRQNKSKNNKYENRTIDIDILFYGSEIIATEELQIPHPRTQERLFSLVPLNELIPDFIHPELNKSLSLLLDECTDENGVKKLDEQI